MSEQLSTRPIELSNQEAATVLKPYLEYIQDNLGKDAGRPLYETICVLEGKEAQIVREYSDEDIIDTLNNIINCTPIPRGDSKSMTRMLGLLALCKAMKVFQERVAYAQSMKSLKNMPVRYLTEPTINKTAVDWAMILNQLKERARNGLSDKDA